VTRSTGHAANGTNCDKGVVVIGAFVRNIYAYLLQDTALHFQHLTEKAQPASTPRKNIFFIMTPLMYQLLHRPFL
jgi:hypothetical protein